MIGLHARGVRRLLAASALLTSALAPVSPSLAQTYNQETAPPGPVRVQLDSMPLGGLVTLLMRDVMKVPYVIAPDVLADRRPVSVNLVMSRTDIPARVVNFLRGVGLSVRLDGGTVFVAKRAMSAGGSSSMLLPGQVAPSGPPAGSPLSPAPSYAVEAQPVTPGQAAPVEIAGSPGLDRSQSGSHGAEDGSVFHEVTAIIEPSHRTPAEFADVLATMLPGMAIAVRKHVEPEGLSVANTLAPERLVLAGTKRQIDRAVAIVTALDKPRPSVAIRAVVMEVSTSRVRGSALSVLADVLGGRVGIRSNAGQAIGDQMLTIATGGVSAVLSAVASDGRFSVVAEPSLSAVSGSLATINSGSQVPTLGGVTVPEDGPAVRSVVYRDSGITLRVRPVVLPGEIQLGLEQERSSFARTNTGVDDSPTLNQATVSAQVSMRPGDTIAIAGLETRGSDRTREGLFGGLLGVRQREENTSQLLLLVQADVAPAISPRAPAVQLLGADADTDLLQPAAVIAS